MLLSFYPYYIILFFFYLDNVIKCKSMELRLYSGMREEVETGVIINIVRVLSVLLRPVYSAHMCRNHFYSIRPHQLIQILWITCDYP